MFKGYLQSTDEDAEEKKAALEEELGKLSEHLKANGPFLKVNHAFQAPSARKHQRSRL